MRFLNNFFFRNWNLCNILSWNFNHNIIFLLNIFINIYPFLYLFITFSFNDFFYVNILWLFNMSLYNIINIVSIFNNVFHWILNNNFIWFFNYSFYSDWNFFYYLKFSIRLVYLVFVHYKKMLKLFKIFIFKEIIILSYNFTVLGI